jgi:hypothetical protein
MTFDEREMKLLKAVACMAVGYVAAILYFSSLMLIRGESLYQHDYRVVLFWVAFYGFGATTVIFLAPFLISNGTARFWNPWICGPIGALMGFLALLLLVPPLALHYMYGGQAAIMGAVTFLLGSRQLRASNKAMHPSAARYRGGV